MQKLLSILLLLLSYTLNFYAQENHYFYVANWNLENLFDTIDEPEKNDADFLPGGGKKWTEKRLAQKLYNLSRVIRYMNDVRGPDILGVQEVEHASLLEMLIDFHFCDKYYGTAYLESPDFRGIDVGLIYNKKLFELLSLDGLEVKLDDGYPTRLILQVKLKHFTGEEIFVFVNHWPSRRGGEKKSEPNRMAAAEVLRKRVDRLFAENQDSNIIIMGDFNDEPKNASVRKILKANKLDCNSISIAGSDSLINLAYKLFDEEKGTYLYRENWNMLDQMIISGALISKGNIEYICDSFEIVAPQFLQTRSGKYKGAAYPSYGGFNYLGGFSDHFPIGAKFKIISKTVEQIE